MTRKVTMHMWMNYCKRYLCVLFLTAFLLVPVCAAVGFEPSEGNAGGKTKGAPLELPVNDSIEYPRERIQSYLTNFSTYEPMYFLIGSDPENSKFQISFKHRLFNPQKNISIAHPWITGIHFGYTQTSLWDLESDSKPFEDTSYKPEIFFISRSIKLKPYWLDNWRIQTGLRHESNGRDGPESRSTNYTYLKTKFVFGRFGDYGFGISPAVWIFYNNDDYTNSDLDDYRGNWEIEAGIAKLEGLLMTAVFRGAREGSTIQIDFTYPLHKLFDNNLDLYFYTQYFNGYSETLKNYDEKESAIRFGIAITR